MRAAQLDTNNTVINFAEVSGFDGVQFIDPQDSVMGSVWDGAEFSNSPPSPPMVPISVTRRQAVQALIDHNLIDNVQAIINSLDDGTPEGLKAKKTAQNEWDNSTEFFRSRPLVIQIGGAIGLGATELDNLFIEAATL